MLTADTIVSLLEDNKQTLRSFGVKRLELFGSFAAGSASAGSDVDLLVEFADGRGLFDDYVSLLEFLEGLFDRQVDLVKPSLLREELRDEVFSGARREAKI